MSLRRRSVLLRVALLVLVPLIFLVGLFAYAVSTSVGSALTLTRSKAMMDDLSGPVGDLQQAITQERAQVIAYYAQPTPAAMTALARRRAVTDRAVAAFQTAAASPAVARSASAGGAKAINTLRADLAGLAPLRAQITHHAITGQQAVTPYNAIIAAGYQVLEQAVLSEGDSARVLPGIAVIELARSGEYLQQESALLNGDLIAHAFPAADRQAFDRLVGAHRLLYAQSVSYLDPSDRAALAREVSAGSANTLAALEDRIVGSDSPAKAPPVSAAVWNQTVTTLSTQIRRVVAQAETRLAADAHASADAKLHKLLLAGGVGLGAVALSLAFSLWIATNLTRQLRGLHDSALDLAEVQLPGVLSRLRAGQDVDVAGQVRMLDTSPDEIGQVKAAFNTAQRTAVEAAVDAARMRRGVSDVFRNLARRSQSLLERQMALIDTLEQRATEPDDLENLFRIDHLTTRMRRHAESLIVLAGDSPTRVFRKPVPFVDVLRAAAAEVEDYARIRVTIHTPAALAGSAVADVVHLLAEFLDNATLFSPPHTEVKVTGEMGAHGYAVEVEDRGLGMSDDQIAALNTSLADPPPFDLSGSDRLGLFVAAQLARRHDIRLTLSPSAYGGVKAIALIPLDLAVPTSAVAGGGVPVLSGAGLVLARGRPAVTAAAGRTRAPTVAAPPSRPGQPAHHPAGPPTAARPVSLAPATAAAHPGGAIPPGRTRSGLPQRIRQTSPAPQALGASASAPAGATGGPRSPEAARSVLAAFQRGWKQGLCEGAADPVPEASAPAADSGPPTAAVEDP